MYTIRYVSKEKTESYRCYDGEDVLTAARRNFVPIPVGCRGGGCGMCKLRVVDGDYEMDICSKAALTEGERKQNYTLACKTYPRTDLIIVPGLLLTEGGI
jgi:CDP-4-dehydro-6-deoxyglucose reductase